ncbi:hypothetical protein HID58_066814, partial [Brassica napus]
MHGYGMGPGSEWSTENWPRSPGEPIRGTIGQADRQHGRARRVSWPVSRPSSPATRLATRPRNIGVVSTAPKTELRKLRTKMHGYGMGPCSEWSTENWLRSPGEPIRGTIEQADRQHGRASWPVSRSELTGELTGNTAVLAGRARRRHGRARRASWPVSKPSSPATRPVTRPCSPGELARVAAELAWRSISAVRFLGFRSFDRY